MNDSKRNIVKTTDYTTLKINNIMTYNTEKFYTLLQWSKFRLTILRSE